MTDRPVAMTGMTAQYGYVACRTLDLPGLVTSRGGKTQTVSIQRTTEFVCVHKRGARYKYGLRPPSSLLVKSRQGSPVIDVLTFSHFPSHKPQSSL